MQGLLNSLNTKPTTSSTFISVPLGKELMDMDCDIMANYRTVKMITDVDKSLILSFIKENEDNCNVILTDRYTLVKLMLPIIENIVSKLPIKDINKEYYEDLHYFVTMHLAEVLIPIYKFHSVKNAEYLGDMERLAHDIYLSVINKSVYTLKGVKYSSFYLYLKLVEYLEQNESPLGLEINDFENEIFEFANGLDYISVVLPKGDRFTSNLLYDTYEEYKKLGK